MKSHSHPGQVDLFHDCGIELSVAEKKTIREAFKILEKALRVPGVSLTSPELVADYMKLNIATRPHEVFVVLFLDNQHRLIETQEMFRGTIDGASVYPREIVKEALHLNAAACILAHNHPSGVTEPSSADRAITQQCLMNEHGCYYPFSHESLRLVGATCPAASNFSRRLKCSRNSRIAAWLSCRNSCISSGVSIG